MLAILTCVVVLLMVVAFGGGCPFDSCGIDYRMKFYYMDSHFTCDSNKFCATLYKFDPICVFFVPK